MAERRKLSSKGEAMPDGSYPIRNAQDLANAYKDYVRTGRPSAVAAWIAKRARALGVPNPVDTDRKTEGDEVSMVRARRSQ